MDDKRGGRGGAKSFGGKGKAGGSYDRKPRAAGERSARPYAKRDGGSDRPARPYVKREGSSEGGSYERKPRAYGERSERPARPYAKREGGSDRPARPYAKREGGSEGGSYERKPRPYGDRPARPYTPRDGGDRPARPYAKREEGGFERKPREYSERKPRAYGERSERPARPYTPRDGGDRPARPYAKREEGGFERKPRGEFTEKRPYENRGEGPGAKFTGKRSIKRDRSEQIVGAGDGWLVGYHAVMAAMTAGRRKVRKVWLLGEAKGELADVLAKHTDWPVEIKSKPEFEHEFGDMVHQGVAVLVGNLAQPSLQEVMAAKPRVIVALDQVTDPHNLGAIVRSCAAFGAAAVLVTEHRAAGMGPTAAKVAAGAMETVPVVEIVNLAQTLEMMKDNGFRVVGLAGEAEQDIADYTDKSPLCLVVGSEGDGLRRLTREHCDVLLKIAISSAIESLNVSVATGVALSLLNKR
jgi:23S rRNA (guanosine2251-2'-O)-methyltransferase